MTYSEIGSEFWQVEPVANDRKYFLSGRTALDYIIRDMKLKHPEINSVLMPSYCCDTMMQPIIDNGLTVRFYKVWAENDGFHVQIPGTSNNEAFFLMTYFGFEMPTGIELEKIRSEWSVIIEDRTHSCFRNDNGYENADYSFISYRKWNAFAGIAEAACIKNFFQEEYSVRTDTRFISLRRSAEKKKKKFINEGDGDKKEFLGLFSRAEDELDKDYRDYGPDIQDCCALANLDIKSLRTIRQNNARILINVLKNVNGVRLIYDSVHNDDAPLFLPIYVEKDRDGLRKYLNDHDIYCPVHWPCSEYADRLNNEAIDIYDHELSLVCDQRYGNEDMEYMASMIRRFYGKKNSFK